MRPTQVWSAAWRTAVALVVVLAGSAASLLLGLGAQPFAWVLAPAVLATLAVATVAVLWMGRRERRRVAVVAAGIAVILGMLVWHASPPGHRVVSWQLDDIEVPAGARLVAENASGNHWCFDYCPSVSRTYHVDGTPVEVAERMAETMRRAGLTLAHEGPEGLSFSTDPTGSTGRHRDIVLDLDLRPAYREPATAHAAPQPIPRTTEVTVRGTARPGF